MNISKEKLIGSFEELYLIEKKAHDLYSKILAEEIPENERHVIQAIHDDEEHHMQIVNEIISIIKEN